MQTKRKDLRIQGREGEGGTNGESSMKIYTIINKRDSQWEFAESSENSNQGSVTT